MSLLHKAMCAKRLWGSWPCSSCQPLPHERPSWVWALAVRYHKVRVPSSLVCAPLCPVTPTQWLYFPFSAFWTSCILHKCAVTQWSLITQPIFGHYSLSLWWNVALSSGAAPVQVRVFSEVLCLGFYADSRLEAQAALRVLWSHQCWYWAQILSLWPT